MLLTVENSKGRKIEIFDCRGHKLSVVLSYDTDTREVEMFVYLPKAEGEEVRPFLMETGPDGSTYPVLVKCKVNGSYAVVDGQKV